MDKRRKSLGTTILVSMIALVVLILAVVYAVMSFRMNEIQDALVESNGTLGDRAGEISSTSMQTEVTDRLMQIANGQADNVDSNFGHFKATVELLASDATYLYEHADAFGRIPIEEPRAENDGKLVVHITHSEKTDMSDPAIIDEIGLLGNESNTLMSAHAGNPSMAKCYIATETGLMIEADRDSSDKINEDGTVAYYEASQRPWYIGTKAAGETFFTNVTPEASGKRIGFMCGSPVRRNGEFMGVACAGMYLDDVDKLVQSTRLGENGIACIVNNLGQLLFTSVNSGTFAITRENADRDLREAENKELAAVVADVVDGKEGYNVINVDDISYCVAYASMETVGWGFLILLPEETVQASTRQLLNELSDITNTTEAETVDSMRKLRFGVLTTGIAALLVAVFSAYLLSKSIVAPVRKLTDQVSRLQGEDLDFSWDTETDYEIQTLAESFGNMTERMKKYIAEVTRVTAEKERIGAELNVATQIQADMLPRIFPPYPDKKEFDLFASMTPAKEVGGDFYDFFLVDDDHLAMVMADVSGKGVPAALFMVIAKTLIKNRTQMGGTPSEILEEVNNQLCEGNDAELFVTVWLGILTLSTGKGIAANAGHEHPAIRHRDGSFELVIYRHSPAVATMEGIPFKEHEFELQPGDTLFVYTDGVPEATDAHDELFGTDRMLEALNRAPDASPQEIVKNVKEGIDTFVAEAQQFDDITMLCLHYNGTS